MLNYCIIIPCYRHADKIEKVITQVEKLNFKIIVVDDGNNEDDAEKLNNIAAVHSLITLLRHKTNLGKSHAVATAMQYAYENKYTHAIQIDADGQHNSCDILTILKLSENNPGCIISGSPIYDKSAPRSRVIGRKITNFFVHIETLSSDIKDAMIGFRCYPVEKTVRNIKKCNLSYGMAFDIEILVRMYWDGVNILFFDTNINYPENGISNFKLKDQVEISLTHTKLTIIMLLTLPWRILRHAENK